MKVTIKGILHWEQSAYSEEPVFAINSHDMTKMSDVHRTYVAIKPVEVEFDIPDNFDPREGIIFGLREQKKKVIADAQLKATQIEERIQRLLAIEYKPEAA